MHLLKQLLKYFYFNFGKKQISVAFNTILDRHSTYGGNNVFHKGVLIGKSKIGTNVIVKDNSAIKRSEISDYTCIHEDCKITESTIGSFTYIAKSTEILGANIGKFCSIGPGVWIGLGKHPSDFISTSPLFYSISKKQLGFTFAENQLFDEYNRCTIGNDVWIGARALILDGVTIGDGAIIAANSVVSKDVEPYTIVGGIPARPIKTRFDDLTIDKLLESAWWNWDIAKIEERKNVFQKPLKSSTDLSF